MSVIIMTDKVYACKSINNGQGRSARERYIQRVAIRSYQSIRQPILFPSKLTPLDWLPLPIIYLGIDWHTLYLIQDHKKSKFVHFFNAF